MDFTAELTGLVRRVSPSTYERLLLLCHCLLLSSEVSEKTQENGTTSTLSLQAICAVLVCACPGSASRFLFVLAGNDKLLRSPDGGRTWRVSFARSCEEDNSTHDCTDASNVLDDMQRLLTSAAALDAESSTPSTLAPAPTLTASPASSSALPAICSAHGYDEVVALCGQDGFLAVSGDRGVTFTTATNFLADSTSSSASLQHIRVLDRQHLLVNDGARVLRIDVSQVSYGRLALGKATVVLTCTSQIVMLHTYSTPCGGRAVMVSERDKLHLSLDGAVSFLEVRHCMGHIRGADPMDAVRWSEQPDFASFVLASSLEADSSPSGSGGTKPPASPYAYISGYKREAPSDVDSHTTALTNFEKVARRYKENIFFQQFFVSGCGTQVLPYDYTAVLCICTRRLPDTSLYIVLSSAAQVNYVPFSHARRREPLPCAVVRRVGSSGYVAGRGSSVGVSISTDLEHWSTPQGTAPVGLMAVCGDELLACGRQKVITTVGTTEEARIVSNELRVPYLIDAFTM
ncbi:hypothetical protein ABB37_06295 [Leptomonas pyrrhocoris]|uniref:Uncharacterized protein n=1 Tax=Leptomonas pyrrhocoris TaxID=157538 RepID=A0A0N0DU64_LEPPY|nr:hypothetical protein ABB37_06295 [Leptomonas pyrrhocoris]XP_015656543.1 hypothetical protein ABB37_06295 [Leptomonas pyrrhocoris]KPA78103.1 hypothetical protein ABB37_06295 [Leptomonas pyrrhocoris]KPA78104.1 hypothetical protein ABB37_06295 [Leptomonas pyrrhocoris]|eukprot:XP_015656542.1 hypothetical protein ABB37_06295 [Leptomonas pyrrhocoris]